MSLVYIYIEETAWWIWDLDWFTFEEFDDLLLEDKMKKRVEEERDQMRKERLSDGERKRKREVEREKKYIYQMQELQ